MRNTRIFLARRPAGWPSGKQAPDWQSWLLGDCRWHLPAGHPALETPLRWLILHPARFEADLHCLRLTGLQQQTLPTDTMDWLHNLLTETLGGLADEIHWLGSAFAIRLHRNDATQFHPLGKVPGENLQHCLPRGERAMQYNSLINAWQMACHGKADNLHGINGLWPARPEPIPADLPLPLCISGEGTTPRRWAESLGVKYQPGTRWTRKGWVWLAQADTLEYHPAGPMQRWLGRSVAVHAGLQGYWPDLEPPP